MQDMAPPDLRGRVAAIGNIGDGIVNGIAPGMVGWISPYLGTDPRNLIVAMGIFAIPSWIIAAIFFRMAERPFEATRRAASADAVPDPITHRKRSEMMNDRTASILQQATACDMTCPWVAAGDKTLRDALPERYRTSGWTYVSLTLASDGDDIASTMQTIAATRRMIDDAFGDLSPGEIGGRHPARQARRQAGAGHALPGIAAGRRAISTWSSLYYELGIRHMLMVYNYKNYVADGCYEEGDGGLSGFGQELVAEMNRVGMIVDVAHTGLQILDGHDRGVHRAGDRQPWQSEGLQRSSPLLYRRADPRDRGVGRRVRPDRARRLPWRQ